MKISASIDKTSFKTKPDPNAVRQMCFMAEDMDSTDLMEGVASEGWTFCPATYTDNRRLNDNFIQTQMIGLDFDGVMGYDEFSERAWDLSIPPSYVYPTFSCSTDKVDRFRAVWLLDKPVTDDSERKNLIVLLMAIFEQKADKSCKDAARMFYGSDRGLIVSEPQTTLGIDLVFLHGEPWLRKLLGKHAARMYIARNVRNTGITSVEDDRVPDKNIPDSKKCSQSHNSLIILENYGKVNKISYPLEQEYLIRKTNTDKCLLLAKIDSWLYHDQVYGLLLNLVNIEGGGKYLLERLENSPFSNEYLEKPWDEYVDYARRHDYHPQACKEFCPHANECNPDGNLIQKLKEMGKIEIVEKKMKSTPEEVYTTLVDTLKTIKHDKKIHVIKCYTGVGKTKAYTELDDVDGHRFTVALPTHKLKSEVQKRLAMKGKDYRATPDLPVFLDPTHRPLIDAYYSIGAFDKVDGVLRRSSEGLRYLRDKEKPLVGDVLCTHSGLINNPTLNKVVIVDEDMFEELISVREIKKSDFAAILRQPELCSDNSKVISKFYDSQICHSPINACHRTEKTKVPKVENLVTTILNANKNGAEITGNIYNLMTSEFLYMPVQSENMIYYVVSRSLPEEQTFILLTATADKFIYSKLFGDRMVWHDIPDPVLTGKIVQHTKYGCSRQGLSVYWDDIIARVPQGESVITFKKFQDKLDPHNILYFGNVEGLDTLRGKNITVLGTPHTRDEVYYLIAACFGHDKGTADTYKREYTIIQHNGKRFKFNTFQQEMIRRIHLYMVDSNLEQAVGRSRVARENCTVTVYSNYPVENAIYIW